jgi:predicted SprT family Zn-dependent metalloprotease
MTKEVYICKKCNKEISKERHEKAIKENWLPLCEKCDPEMRENFKKWYPLFQKFKF